MSYDKIHACPNDCVLFRNEYAALNECPKCGAHDCHFLQDLLDIIVVLNIELRAKLRDHSIVKIGTIVHDDPFRDSIPTDKVILNETSHNILGNENK